MALKIQMVRQGGKKLIRRLCYVNVLAFLVAGMWSAHAQGRKSAWPPETFPIGMWCSPPEPFITVEQYRKIAAAGFTVVLPPCEGQSSIARNRKILETARNTGLKVLLADPRIPLTIGKAPGALAAIKAVVSEYRKSPALLGYYLTDEPGAESFTGIGEVAAEIHRLDPDHLVYINLFPNYATAAQLGASSYDEYLDRFAAAVKPDVISYDHYPFLTSGDRPGYFANLASVQRVAVQQQPPVPFWQIMLSVQHGAYRKLSENELRFQAVQSLVYGAQGVVYFTYWLPNDPSFEWSNAIMNRDGTEGPLYQAAKTVNQEVLRLGRWLYGTRVLGTYQTGDVAPEARPLGNDVPVSVTGGGNLSIGLMRDSNGYLIVMVTNRDYRNGTTVGALLDAGQHAIEMLDVKTNRWQPVNNKPDSEGRTPLTLVLAPAGYSLIRWQ